MFDLVYRFDPNIPDDCPPDAAHAVSRLEDGNRQFAKMLTPTVGTGGDTVQVVRFNADALGLPREDGTAPIQAPFAAVLGCSDARAPIEMIFGQACNDLFVVRVAGNVLGSECLGSLDYALTNLGQRLRVVVVLGHSGCGAVTAAVDAFIEPSRYLQFAANHPLRAILDRIFPAVRAAHWALEQVHGQRVEALPGYRTALVETSVALNAALTASSLQHDFGERLGGRQVVYGVYDLVSRRVKLPLEADGGVSIRLAAPPATAAAFDGLGILLAGSGVVRDRLG